MVIERQLPNELPYLAHLTLGPIRKLADRWRPVQVVIERIHPEGDLLWHPHGIPRGDPPGQIIKLDCGDPEWLKRVIGHRSQLIRVWIAESD